MPEAALSTIETLRRFSQDVMAQRAEVNERRARSIRVSCLLDGERRSLKATDDWTSGTIDVVGHDGVNRKTVYDFIAGRITKP